MYPQPKPSRRAAARYERIRYGQVFRMGKDLVQYGYSRGKKIGLFFHKGAKTYSKARYTARQGYHAYRTYKKFRK